MTPNEYLESSLKSERGISDDISARNRVRMLLTTFFNKRDCACLPRPVTDESELSQLGQGNDTGTGHRRVGTGQHLAMTDADKAWRG